jgi:predicted nucleotidyltransferase
VSYEDLTLAVQCPAVTEPEIEAIREWARSVPIVSRVWIFGSRSRLDYTPESDLDIAVEHDSLPGDGSILATSIGELAAWEAQLQSKINLRVDLESYIPGVTPTIESALDESSVLIYERQLT